MKELYLTAAAYIDGTYKVCRKLRNITQLEEDSVFIIKEWPYTPWPRKGGNILW
jgi:hypothetical protein